MVLVCAAFFRDGSFFVKLILINEAIGWKTFGCLACDRIKEFAVATLLDNAADVFGVLRFAIVYHLVVIEIA